MLVGIPMEIKNNESRVAITPAGVNALKLQGHTVYVQKGAGIGSGFTDEEYKKEGALILDTIEEVYEPFLIQEGYLERTPKGRMATQACYTRLGIASPLRSGELPL